MVWQNGNATCLFFHSATFNEALCVRFEIKNCTSTIPFFPWLRFSLVSFLANSCLLCFLHPLFSPWSIQSRFCFTCCRARSVLIIRSFGKKVVIAICYKYVALLHDWNKAAHFPNDLIWFTQLAYQAVSLLADKWHYIYAVLALFAASYVFRSCLIYVYNNIIHLHFVCRGPP